MNFNALVCGLVGWCAWVTTVAHAQNQMSNYIRQGNAAYSNGDGTYAVPKHIRDKYDALANMRDPGLQGNGGFSPASVQFQQMMQQEIARVQQRLAEIEAEAKQRIQQDTRNIRSQSARSEAKIRQAASQALANLDAIDRAESGRSQTRVNPTPSRRPDREFGSYVAGRDKVVAWVGSTPLYALEGWDYESETPLQQALEAALDLPPAMTPDDMGSFVPGDAALDLPNSAALPDDGEPLILRKEDETWSPPTGKENTTEDPSSDGSATSPEPLPLTEAGTEGTTATQTLTMASPDMTGVSPTTSSVQDTDPVSLEIKDANGQVQTITFASRDALFQQALQAQADVTLASATQLNSGFALQQYAETTLQKMQINQRPLDRMTGYMTSGDFQEHRAEQFQSGYWTAWRGGSEFVMGTLGGALDNRMPKLKLGSRIVAGYEMMRDSMLGDQTAFKAGSGVAQVGNAPFRVSGTLKAAELWEQYQQPANSWWDTSGKIAKGADFAVEVGGQLQKLKPTGNLAERKTTGIRAEPLVTLGQGVSQMLSAVQSATDQLRAQQFYAKTQHEHLKEIQTFTSLRQRMSAANQAKQKAVLDALKMADPDLYANLQDPMVLLANEWQDKKSYELLERAKRRLENQRTAKP